MSSNKYKVLLADDHAMIRSGLRSMLSAFKEYQVVGEATNGNQAVEMFEKLKPDLAIIDISMPDKNGMETSKEILQANSGAKIIILSMYDDEDYISACMEIGVSGYVIKSESIDELEYAIKTVLKGQTYFSSQVQKVVFNQYTHNLKKKKTSEPVITLTARELEIVKLIAEGLTSHQMAHRLFISPRTVETHRANLMKKVGVKNAVELVKKMERMGLLE